MKFFLLFFSLLYFAQNTNACETGFACSIDNMQQMQYQQEVFMLIYLDNLFDKKLNENLFFARPFYTENYNDMFIFNSII